MKNKQTISIQLIILFIFSQQSQSQLYSLIYILNSIELKMGQSFCIRKKQRVLTRSSKSQLRYHNLFDDDDDEICLVRSNKCIEDFKQSYSSFQSSLIPLEKKKKHKIIITDVTDQYSNLLINNPIHSVTHDDNVNEKIVNQLELQREDQLEQNAKLQELIDQSINLENYAKLFSEEKNLQPEAVLDQLTELIQSTFDLKVEGKPEQEQSYLRMSVINDSSFFSPITQLDQQYIDELNKTQYNLKEISGITFIYNTIHVQPNYQTQYQTPDRFCQLHNSQIFHICFETSCIQNLLICPFCIKDHRLHNQVELQDLIAFVKGRQVQLQQIEFHFNKMFNQQHLQLKELSQIIDESRKNQFDQVQHYSALGQSKKLARHSEKEGSALQLVEVEQELQTYLLTQNQFYEEILGNLLNGGLSQINQAVALFNQKEGSRLQLQTINFQIQQFVQKIQQIWQNMFQFQEPLQENNLNSNISILIHDIVLQINGNQILKYNDLDEQIKEELLRQNLLEIFFYDLMWVQENQVIKLCKNYQNIEQSLLFSMKSIKIIYIN